MKLFERTDLLAQFFTIANNVFGGHRRIEATLLLLLPLNESSYAVQSDTPVVTDDAAPAVSVGQAGQNMRTTAFPDLRRIGIEYCLVVCLSVFGKGFHHRRVRRVAVRFK